MSINCTVSNTVAHVWGLEQTSNALCPSLTYWMLGFHVLWVRFIDVMFLYCTDGICYHPTPKPSPNTKLQAFLDSQNT